MIIDPGDHRLRVLLAFLVAEIRAAQVHAYAPVPDYRVRSACPADLVTAQPVAGAVSDLDAGVDAVEVCQQPFLLRCQIHAVEGLLDTVVGPVPVRLIGPHLEVIGIGRRYDQELVVVK